MRHRWGSNSATDTRQAEDALDKWNAWYIFNHYFRILTWEPCRVMNRRTHQNDRYVSSLRHNEDLPGPSSHVKDGRRASYGNDTVCPY